MWTKKRKEALDQLRKVLIEECSSKTISVNLLLKGDGWEITRKEKTKDCPDKVNNLSGELIK